MSTLFRIETVVTILIALAVLAPRALGRDEPPGAAPEGLVASAESGWPQWRGLRRDGVADEKGLLARWPEGGPKLLWKVDGLGRGWSSPIVVGERLYVTGDVEDDLVLFALDLDGTPRWRVVAPMYQSCQP